MVKASDTQSGGPSSSPAQAISRQFPFQSKGPPLSQLHGCLLSVGVLTNACYVSVRLVFCTCFWFRNSSGVPIKKLQPLYTKACYFCLFLQRGITQFFLLQCSSQGCMIFLHITGLYDSVSVHDLENLCSLARVSVQRWLPHKWYEGEGAHPGDVALEVCCE